MSTMAYPPFMSARLSDLLVTHIHALAAVELFKNFATGEGRCPWQNWVLAFPTELRPWAEGPREDKAGSVALNHPDASRR